MKIMENGVLRDATEGEIAEIEAQQSVEIVEPVPTSVSRRQLLTGLAVVGWVSEQEAEAALATGALPTAVETVINSLPEEERFTARMKWIGFQTAYRDDPMVAALAAAEEKTEQEVDDFFRLCAGID